MDSFSEKIKNIYICYYVYQCNEVLFNERMIIGKAITTPRIPHPSPLEPRSFPTGVKFYKQASVPEKQDKNF